MRFAHQTHCLPRVDCIALWVKSVNETMIGGSFMLFFCVCKLQWFARVPKLQHHEISGFRLSYSSSMPSEGPWPQAFDPRSQ
jgi:hypothetical protein